ncbi:MAG: diaminopimelate decarboxylase, partial [Patescibacteria group bacterium]
AVKANPNPEILKIIADEGFGVDCSSESEAWISEKLGIKGMYTGNYTTEEEFSFVKDKGMILNLDDISMIPTIAKLGMPETISFRINPGIGKATMENNVFAGPDAKYGVPFEKAHMAYSAAWDAGAKRFGIHMMTGSNVPISEQDYFAGIVRKLFEIVADVKEKTGIEIEMMNIGGGFGVPYHPDEKSLDMDVVAKSIREVFDEQCSQYGLKEPRLIAEPGRFLAADTGFLVSRVHVIKDSYKKFVGIDASANDMPRPAIYGAYHYISVLNDSKETEKVSVVGRICENNDQFVRDRELPKTKVGDTVVIHNCGGHAYAMGHNYNGRPRHAEYLLTLDGEFRQIRRAETIENLFRTTNYGN